MYQILATKMAVPTGGTVTQAISMQGANAVTVDITVFSGTISDVDLEGSNDLENWTTLESSMVTGGSMAVGAYYLPGTYQGAFSGPEKDVATQYVRLKLTAGSAAIVACGINTSQQ